MTDPTEWFNTVYESTYAALRKTAIIKARTVMDVDDLLQNTYTRFYRHICRYGTGAVKEPSGYLMTVLKREIATYYRTHRKSVQITEEIPLPSEQSTESIGVHRAEIDEIYACVQRESALSQKIFELFYGYGMQTAEIAAALGKKEATIRSRLFRTRENIKKQLHLEEI